MTTTMFVELKKQITAVIIIIMIINNSQKYLSNSQKFSWRTVRPRLTYTKHRIDRPVSK